MDWITEKDAAKAAKEGKIPALKMSWEHHNQGATADYVPLKQAIDDEKFKISYNLCAVCWFNGGGKDCFKACGECCLSDRQCCGKLIGIADNALNVIRNNPKPSNDECKAFQDAEAAVCKYIKKVIEQEEAKAEELSKAVKHLANLKCKESKRLVKDGDYSVRLEDYGDERYIHVMLYNDIYNNFHGKNPPGYAPEIDIFQGNFFDLIAEQNKELDEFEINHKKPLEGKVKVGQAIDPSGLVYMRVNGGTATENSGLFHFDLDELDEFIAKLTQARNYARNHK